MARARAFRLRRIIAIPFLPMTATEILRTAENRATRVRKLARMDGQYSAHLVGKNIGLLSTVNV